MRSSGRSGHANLVSGEANVGDINGNGNGINIRGAVGISSVGPALGPELNSVKITVVVDIVSGRQTSRHLCAVIQPADQAIAVDMKDLFGAVRRDGRGEGNLEPPSLLAV